MPERRSSLAAGDTFRAAAAEQLTMWAERSDVPIVRGAEGADPSSVVFDAVESANARNADVVLADTAGRLQTKTNLMEELSKVRRVAEKGAGTVTETLLVIDATTGQNGMSQAKQFADAVDVSGVVPSSMVRPTPSNGLGEGRCMTSSSSTRSSSMVRLSRAPGGLPSWVGGHRHPWLTELGAANAEREQMLSSAV